MRRNIVGTRKYNTSSCEVQQNIVQTRKDELLTTLEKFFEQSLTKNELRYKLATIKANIQKTCQ